MARRAIPAAGFTIIELLVVVLIIGLLFALLLPAVQAAREAARRGQCANNLRQIGVALHLYHDRARHLPPSVADHWGGSQHLHTWCVFLLPYLEQDALHEGYSYAAGVNAAANAKIVAAPLAIYLCPSSDDSQYEGNGAFAPGNYGAVSGTQPVDNGGPLFPASKVKFRDIRDGLSNTVAVGEIYFHNLGWARGSAANTTGGGGGGGAAYSRGVARWWRCNSPCAIAGLNPPRTDCNNFCERRFQFSSAHPNGANFVNCDGHLEFLPETIDRDALRARMTIAASDVSTFSP